MTRFEILGEPQGKARPRVTMRGGFAHAYTPKKTMDYEQKIRNAYTLANGINYENKPLMLSVQVLHLVPKSFLGKREKRR